MREGLLAVILAVVVAVTVAAALLLCLAHPGRTQVVALSIFAFPFLYAVSPASWYWQDGRYVTYLWPLLCLALIAACELVPSTLRRLRRRPPPMRTVRRAFSRLIAIGIVAVMVSLSLAAFFAVYVPSGILSFFSSWSRPDAPGESVAHALLRRHLQVGYANYWIAYKLDYLSGGLLQYTPTAQDSPRNTTLSEAVRAHHPESWLFIAPSSTQAGAAQFVGLSVAQSGPPGMPEQLFASDLRRLGVPSTVAHVGMLRAVTPSRNVTLLPNLSVRLARTQRSGR